MKHYGVEADDDEERQKVGRDEEDGLQGRLSDSGQRRAAISRSERASEIK